MFIFKVQGSAKAPYEITGQGSGDELFVKCTCPAWQRGGLFCKHVAAILVGDITDVVDGADAIPRFVEAARGTRYAANALAHKPSGSPRVDGIDTLSQLVQMYQSSLEATGWSVIYTPPVAPSLDEQVALYKSYKNGKRYKNASLSLSFTEWAYDYTMGEDGDLIQQNRRLSVRPWRVTGGFSYGSLARAIPEFLKAAKIKSK